MNDSIKISKIVIISRTKNPFFGGLGFWGGCVWFGVGLLGGRRVFNNKKKKKNMVNVCSCCTLTERGSMRNPFSSSSDDTCSHVDVMMMVTIGNFVS